MYHSLGLLAIGILAYNVPESVVRTPAIIMIIGIFFFQEAYTLFH